MEQEIQIRYVNERLQIGMADIRHVYQLHPSLLQLKTEVYRGKFVYRAPGSCTRISYDQLKKGLVKRPCRIRIHVPF